MKNCNQIRLYRIVKLLFVTLIIISSCKKNDDDTYVGYNGKWMTERAIPYIYGYASVSYYLTISENKYNESFYILPHSIYDAYEFVSIEGSLSVSDNHMLFKPEKLSYYNCNRKMEKIDPPYSTLPYFEDANGNSLSGLFYPVSNHEAEFLFDGKTLNLQIDYDDDGDYSEYPETIPYARP